MLKKFFISNSIFKEDRKNFFFSRRILKKKDIQIPLKYYLVSNKFYKDYLFYKVFCKHLSKKAKAKSLEPYFLTLTKQFNLGKMNTFMAIYYMRETIKVYREALREIIREFQRTNDILFISVIEFNENLFFHLHAIIYINPLFEDKFLKILENKISLFELGFEKRFEKINIEKDNKNLQKSCEYLLKTLKKASKDTEYAYLLDGAVNVLKYKLITHSKTNLNKKMYFKLLPHVLNQKRFKDSNYKFKDEKFLDIYEYLLKNVRVKIFTKIPGKESLKKLLKTYKKGKFFIFEERKEVEKADDFIEFQNSLLIKRILSCNNKEEVLKNINDFVNNYIESIKGKFSNKVLMNFRWKVNVLKEFLIKSEIREFIEELKTVLLYHSEKTTLHFIPYSSI